MLCIKYTFKEKLNLALGSRKFLIQLSVATLNWFGNTFVYDGLSFNIGALGGNPYLNYLYSALVELAGLMVSHYSLEKYGRKKPYSFVFILAGVSLLCIQFVPSGIYNSLNLFCNKNFYLIKKTEMTNVITGLALFGKFAISFTYNAVYVVTAEVLILNCNVFNSILAVNTTKIIEFSIIKSGFSNFFLQIRS